MVRAHAGELIIFFYFFHHSKIVLLGSVGVVWESDEFLAGVGLSGSEGMRWGVYGIAACRW